MAQLDNDPIAPVGPLTDTRKAALKLTSTAIRQKDLVGLETALQALGLKESPEPAKPDHRNEFGRVLH